MQYITKSEVIEAVQFPKCYFERQTLPLVPDVILDFVGRKQIASGTYFLSVVGTLPDRIAIIKKGHFETVEQWMLSEGQWLIRRGGGQFEVISDQLFKRLFLELPV